MKQTSYAKLAAILMGVIFMAGSANASARSYITGGLTVTHDTADEGMYYDTPAIEVAYAMSVMRTTGNQYFTIYHSEPRKTPGMGYPGDSIKTGIHSGIFDYKMPADKDFRFYGHPTDKRSMLYSPELHGVEGWGGAGNPMVVKGRGDDPYYYMFFVAVDDDDQDHDLSEADFRHYLCQGRSLNMKDWELRVDVSGRDVVWKPFKEDSPLADRRPYPLKDTKGQYVRSQVATKCELSQGLLGSISYHKGTYYFFYTALSSDGESYLYCRTMAEGKIGQGLWSPEKRVSSEPLMYGTLIKAGKAHGMDRWAVFYLGYKLVDGKPVGDLMLQYTENMKPIGDGGISSLRFYDSWVDGVAVSKDHYLGLEKGAAKAQLYFMIDEYGNLTVPDKEDQSYKRGGMVFWTDCVPSIIGAKVYRAGWDVSR
ncbi:MAG: hypothetical protein ACYC0V_08215 [Armatimonadota bacterium]